MMAISAPGQNLLRPHAEMEPLNATSPIAVAVAAMLRIVVMSGSPVGPA